MGKWTALFVASSILIAAILCASRLDSASAQQPPCKPENIDFALVKTQALHSAMWNHPIHAPAFFKAQAASLYDLIPACDTLEERANLNDSQITKYGAVALLGYCDIALSMSAARAYQFGRDSLTACLNNLNKMRAVGMARKWTAFFEYEKRFRPLLEQTDQLLTEKGYPPK